MFKSLEVHRFNSMPTPLFDSLTFCNHALTELIVYISNKYSLCRYVLSLFDCCLDKSKKILIQSETHLVRDLPLQTSIPCFHLPTHHALTGKACFNNLIVLKIIFATKCQAMDGQLRGRTACIVYLFRSPFETTTGFAISERWPTS